jgi:hypothetical protein
VTEVGCRRGRRVLPPAWRYLWASPNTLLGLLLALFSLATGSGARVVNGVVEVHGGLLSKVLRRCVPLPGGAAAITIGHVILGQDVASLARVRRHEHVHVRQYERWGPAFLPAYLMASIWARIRTGHAYRGNHFEREAYAERAHGDSVAARSTHTGPGE